MKTLISHILFLALWSIICAPLIILVSLHHVGHHEMSSQNCVEHCISELDIRTEGSIPFFFSFQKFVSGGVPIFLGFQEFLLVFIFMLLGNLLFHRHLWYLQKDYTSLIGIIKSTT